MKVTVVGMNLQVVSKPRIMGTIVGERDYYYEGVSAFKYYRLGSDCYYNSFTTFTVTFQQWKLYNSNYLFYIAIYKKKSQTAKLLWHKYVQI